MQLPEHVRRYIDERAGEIDFADLKRAASEMSLAYRAGRPAADVIAYLVARMPATYAAVRAALSQLPEGVAIANVLDAGAGTGAASIAAREIFPQAEITMLERDRAMAEAARDLLPDARISVEDLAHSRGLASHDLVVASYSLGETHVGLADRLWEATRKILIVIEPGTPRGFAVVRQVRDQLLNGGACMAAPCPASTPCPMKDPDWCHFAARVERSSLHRRIKDAELGYEDEKFSFVAFSRMPLALAPARVVRRPVHRAGLIELQVCTPEGIRAERVTKKNREVFRAARKADWGSAFRTADSGRSTRSFRGPELP